jgi:hypothetical protein
LGAFQLANDSISADQNVGVDAVYTPALGSPVGVRLVWEAPDESVSLGGNMTSRLAKTTARVRVSQVADPKKGDTIEVEGTTYTIGNRHKDDTGLDWLLDLKQPTTEG